jgi:uncharacterized membrane protein YczE
MTLHPAIAHSRTSGPPILRAGRSVRVVLLVFGLLLFAAGIVAMYESRLGLSPWDVLHQGLARRTPLTFGEANIVVSVAVLTLAWRMGAKIGAGTLCNAIGVGAFVQILASIPTVAALSHDALGARSGLLAGGLTLIGAGTGLYVSAGLGAGPRDSLMLAAARRGGLRIGVVRVLLELTALCAGLALGGAAGIGTVAFAVSIGALVELAFWALARSPLAAPDPTGEQRAPRIMSRPRRLRGWNVA